ncbi:DUF4276 family protein [Spirosoma sordidisoli]|uniref:DUF4276 family protein n=1 Tax=Spirosoma sordidisoli TaxID=2502893 RepID=A0A4Q2UI53_9BACT|nr:DUF4276 family protein [Spirosoma sordidisoli]RYC69093.1 DUF4276 family protein [Spirosoma sordidisoli]
MRKIAVFVEGQAELIFVREFLLKWFNYNIDLECRNLFTDGQSHQAEFDFPISTAPIHVQVINVGGDGNVLSRMLGREQLLHNAGYETIIGLRDMYSEEYKKKVKNQTVDPAISELFKNGATVTIYQRAKQPDSMKLCFAIMEIEAWWLGIPTVWHSFDSTIQNQFADAFTRPESVFHPATLINKLLQSRHQSYKKYKGEVESIVSRISLQDYIDLRDSQRCPSFCEFVDHINT